MGGWIFYLVAFELNLRYHGWYWMPNVWSNLVHIFWAKIGVLATFKIQGIFGRTLCTHAVINVCWTSAHSYFTSRYFHRKYLCDDIVHTVLAVLGPMGVYMPLKIAGTIWKFYFIKPLGLFKCRVQYSTYDILWRHFKYLEMWFCKEFCPIMGVGTTTLVFWSHACSSLLVWPLGCFLALLHYDHLQLAR